MGKMSELAAEFAELKRCGEALIGISETYINLLTSGRLNACLADIDEQAKDMFFRLVKEYADRQGVTEQLKADTPLRWVQKMNNIRSAVEEVINTELIYA